MTASTQTSPKIVTETTVIQHMAAGFRVHVPPHMGNMSENDPKRGASQLLGVLGFRHLGLYVDLPLLISHYFGGRDRGIGLRHIVEAYLV